MAENNSYPNMAVPAEDTAADSTAEHNDWHSITQGGLTTPIAPEGGVSAYSGNINNNSNMAGNTSCNMTDRMNSNIAGNMTGNRNSNIASNMTGNTNSSMTPRMAGSIPAFPNLPGSSAAICPGNLCSLFPNSSYGQVRFIDASTNTIPVNFSIDGVTYASNFMFSHVSNYQQISDGFHTVSVNRSTGMRALLLQKTFPFTANEKVTMVLVDAKEGGLDLIQISDTGCNNLASGYGCYRVVNVSYSDSSFDIKLANGDTIFRNVGFTQASSYKQAMVGTYTMFVVNSSFYSIIRELPTILIGAITGTNSVSSPLTSTNVNIQDATRTTSYIMGNNWSGYSLRMITVKD